MRSMLQANLVQSQRLPADVELILSALEAGQESTLNQRELQRMSYRVQASLRLFSDPDHAPRWILYTRDVNDKSLGFISPQRLPLGYGGIIELSAPTGELLSIPCTLFRCRSCAPGWFEGAMYFNRQQHQFEVDQS
jgi:hypothetical protein